MLGNHEWKLVTEPRPDGVAYIKFLGHDRNKLMSEGLVRVICTFDDATTQELLIDEILSYGAWMIELKGRQLIGVYLECRPKK